jgi:hypothetical protein
VIVNGGANGMCDKAPTAYADSVICSWAARKVADTPPVDQDSNFIHRISYKTEEPGLASVCGQGFILHTWAQL